MSRNRFWRFGIQCCASEVRRPTDPGHETRVPWRSRSQALVRTRGGYKHSLAWSCPRLPPSGIMHVVAAPCSQDALCHAWLCRAQMRPRDPMCFPDRSTSGIAGTCGSTTPSPADDPVKGRSCLLRSLPQSSSCCTREWKRHAAKAGVHAAKESCVALPFQESVSIPNRLLGLVPGSLPIWNHCDVCEDVSLRLVRGACLETQKVSRGEAARRKRRVIHISCEEPPLIPKCGALAISRKR